MASSAVKRDNRLKTLEISFDQKKEECVKLENQLKKVKHNVNPQIGKELQDTYYKLSEVAHLHLLSYVVCCACYVFSSSFGSVKFLDNFFYVVGFSTLLLIALFDAIQISPRLLDLDSVEGKG